MYDLVVIGAGPGGYPAAVFAAQSGLKVCVIEKADLGGVCLNWGCIPTKALLKASEHLTHMKHAQEWGINAEVKSVDIKKMVQQSRETVNKLTTGIGYLFKTNKIDVIKATATIKSHTDSEVVLLCDGKEVKANNIIIATGARARLLPEQIVSTPKSKHIWGVHEAMTPETIPKTLAIIGAGAIGIEFAAFYAALGVQVAVFEMAANILAGIDSEIAKLMQKELEKLGVQFNLGATINKIEEKSGKVVLEHAGKKDEFDNVIVAIGVIPNVEDFAQLETEKGYFKTNEKHQSFIKGKMQSNIFAIGDCCAPPWLAHKATAEGIRAVKTILKQHVGKFSAVPLCIYTNPQIASIGYTEDQLKTQYGADFSKKVKVARSSFMANGKAVAIKEPVGMVKILCSRDTGELLGAHIIGHDATELIHSLALGMQLEALPQDFADTIFPHPTLSEAVWEAFLEALHH